MQPGADRASTSRRRHDAEPYRTGTGYANFRSKAQAPSGAPTINPRASQRARGFAFVEQCRADTCRGEHDRADSDHVSQFPYINESPPCCPARSATTA